MKSIICHSCFLQQLVISLPICPIWLILNSVVLLDWLSIKVRGSSPFFFFFFFFFFFNYSTAASHPTMLMCWCEVEFSFPSQPVAIPRPNYLAIGNTPKLPTWKSLIDHQILKCIYYPFWCLLSIKFSHTTCWILQELSFNCRLIFKSRLLLVFVLGMLITRSFHNLFLKIVSFYHIFFYITSNNVI